MRPSRSSTLIGWPSISAATSRAGGGSAVAVRYWRRRRGRRRRRGERGQTHRITSTGPPRPRAGREYRAPTRMGPPVGPGCGGAAIPHARARVVRKKSHTPQRAAWEVAVARVEPLHRAARAAAWRPPRPRGTTASRVVHEERGAVRCGPRGALVRPPAAARAAERARPAGRASTAQRSRPRATRGQARGRPRAFAHAAAARAHRGRRRPSTAWR
jgi:hypothetical protein